MTERVFCLRLDSHQRLALRAVRPVALLVAQVVHYYGSKSHLAIDINAPGFVVRTQPACLFEPWINQSSAGGVFRLPSEFVISYLFVVVRARAQASA